MRSENLSKLKFLLRDKLATKLPDVGVCFIDTTSKVGSSNFLNNSTLCTSNPLIVVEARSSSSLVVFGTQTQNHLTDH